MSINLNFQNESLSRRPPTMGCFLVRQTNYIRIAAPAQMLLSLMELSHSGRPRLPSTELKGVEEFHFLAGACCKNPCYKFPAHPENHRADGHKAHASTRTQPCNSGLLVCPVLFSVFFLPFFLTVLIMFIYTSVLIAAVRRACNYCI